MGSNERGLFEKMAEIMYGSGGIGLAAPQVGINKQIIVVDIGKGLYTLINPKIKKSIGSWVMQEGCLSVPEVYVGVKRAQKILVEYIDENNKKISLWTDDLFARVIQHEIDHLKGKLIVDYVNFVKKIAIKRKLKLKSKKDKIL